VVSAVLQTSFLGDMILTTPLLERLAERGRVVVVATPANAALLVNHRAVSEVIVFDKRGADRGIGGLRRVANRLRALHADVAYLAQGSLRTAAVAWLARIPERVGFTTSPGRVLYTAQVPFRRELHHAARLWQLASASSDPATPTTLRPTLYPTDADFAQVHALLAEQGVRDLERHEAADGTRLIALAPGSVWATKRWPSFDALAAELARDPVLRSHRVVVLGAASDAPLAAAIVHALREVNAPAAIDLTGKLSLLGSAALLSRSSALVTNDSAPLHLASAMNTPTLALFGPTIPGFGFGPLAERNTIVERDGLACRPCHAHGPQQCPLQHWHCMRELTADVVSSRLREVITQPDQ
jgi:heptosyltransferase-2